MRKWRAAGCIAAAAAVLVVSVAPTALAARVGRQRAAALAKRAASTRTERFGLTYPPSAWRAACDASRRRLALCGRYARPRLGRRDNHRHERPSQVRKVDVSCFD